MKRKGHPIRGAIFGLLLGLFIALDLSMYHMMSLGLITLYVIPAVGLVLGIVLGKVAPFGRKRTAEPPPLTSTVE